MAIALTVHIYIAWNGDGCFLLMFNIASHLYTEYLQLIDPRKRHQNELKSLD